MSSETVRVIVSYPGGETASIEGTNVASLFVGRHYDLDSCVIKISNESGTRVVTPEEKLTENDVVMIAQSKTTSGC
jgi:hypothetical protein